MSYWFVDRVLPGFVDGIPYLGIATLGLWLNWRATKKHVDKTVTQQNADIQAQLDAQTRDLKGSKHGGS